MQLFKKVSLILLALFIAYSQQASAQSACFPVQLADKLISLPCGVSCTSMVVKVPDLRKTSDYVISTIPYTPYPFVTAAAGLNAIYIDDVFSDLITMPFTFCFYDSTYSTCVIGSNGVVTFDAGEATGDNAWPLTTSGGTGTPVPIPYSGSTGTGQGATDYPRASIMGPMHDIFPTNSANGTRKIEYSVVGTAPCRKFIVSYFNVPMFSCTSLLNTTQIVLHESTGIIDVFIQNKPSCPGWNQGLAILGITNWAEDKAVVAPGKNATSWSATNEGYRFTPSGGNSQLVSVQLIKNGTVVATGTTSPGTPGQVNASFNNFCQTEDSMSYVVRATYISCSDITQTITGEDTLVIKKTPNLNSSAVPIAAPCGTTLGTITMGIPTLGTSPYAYALNGVPQPGNIFTNLAPGNYVATVTDAGVCSTTYNVVVGSIVNIAATFNVTNSSCGGGASGSITVNATNGNAPYEYSINGGPYQTSNVFNNLAPGTYFITIKDATNCVKPNLQVGVAPGPPLTVTANSANTTCPGINDGTITLVPTSGAAPYQYSLNGLPFQGSNVYTGLAPGTYFVTVKDANNCLLANIQVLVAPGTALTATAVATPAACSGVNNGTITVTPTNGTGPYTYSLNGAAFQGGNTFSNLAPGNYTVVVKTAAGCTSAAIPVTVSAGATLQATAAPTATSCNGAANGSITVTATNGTGPYQYAINGGAFQTGNTFTGLAAGNYTIVMSDANGCLTAAIPVTIAAGPAITATAAPVATACSGINNGSITVTPTSGTGPYQYSINGSAFGSSNVFTSLAPGTYTIVVKDALGCTTANILSTVATGSALVATTATTATSCNGAANGTITVTPTNGNSPYEYAIDGGAFGASNVFNNLSSGAHTIIVKDANGCISAAIPVSIAVGPALAATTATTATSCNGAANGTITVTPTNGNSPYQYAIDGGAFGGSNVFNNLTSGAHTIIVKDANGCVSNAIPVTVAAGATLAATAVATATSCNGAANGTITVTPTNGNSPYQYAIDGGAFGGSNVFNNLASGAHTLLVKDANGCVSNTINATVAVGPDLAATLVPLGTSCIGANNGSITVNPTNGTSPYQYSLNGGAFGGSNLFSNLAPGNYTIVVKDAAGCNSAAFPTTVTQGSGLTASVATTDVDCNGNNNGSITVTPTNGSNPFQYSLDNVAFSSSNIFNGLAPGSYTVYIKDGINCTGNQTFTITQPAVLNASATPTAVNCNGQNNGKIDISATGGTAPYEYSLNGGAYQTGSQFTVIAGTYSITVKDAKNCTRTLSVTVTEPPVLTATVAATNATCDGGSDGRITVTPAGGSGSYEYSLDGVVFQPGNVFNVLPNNYTVTIRDAKGCNITRNVSVGLTNNLTLTPGNNLTFCEGKSQQLSVNSNATVYSWSPATGLSNANISNPVASPVVSTQYIVTATLGVCSVKDTIDITVNPAPVADAGTGTTICMGKTYQLSGSGGITYLWRPAADLDNPNSPNPVATPRATTVYFLKVTDALGCESLREDTAIITVTPPITAYAGKDSIVSAGDQIPLLANGGGNIFTWSPTTGLNNPNIANPIATISQDITYKVVVSTIDGCKGEAFVSFRVFKGPDIYVPTGFTPNGDNHNDVLTPLPVGITKYNYFRVYNRWGQEIFSTTQFGKGWDGKYKGIEQPTGPYVWLIQGVTKDNKLITKKGTVMIIR
jgi:gliding motility-associated-like protein